MSCQTNISGSLSCFRPLTIVFNSLANAVSYNSLTKPRGVICNRVAECYI